MLSVFSFFFYYLTFSQFGIICFSIEELCDIDVNDRLRVGHEATTEQDCVKNELDRLLCYKNDFGCYRPKFEMPGFNVKFGDVEGGNLNINLIGEKYKDPVSCVNACLELPDCLGVSLAENPVDDKYCFPKKVSFIENFNNSHVITFDRCAFKHTTCYLESCSNNQLDTNSKNFSTCQQLCVQNDECTTFDKSPNDCKINGKCEMTRKYPHVMSCSKYPVKLFKSDMTTLAEIENLVDGNIGTCVPLLRIDHIYRLQIGF